jgi:hypothetical protein
MQIPDKPTPANSEGLPPPGNEEELKASVKELLEASGIEGEADDESASAAPQKELPAQGASN